MLLVIVDESFVLMYIKENFYLRKTNCIPFFFLHIAISVLLFLSDWMPENQIRSKKSNVTAASLPVCMCINTKLLLLYKQYLNMKRLLMLVFLGSKQILLEKSWKKIF